MDSSSGSGGVGAPGRPAPEPLSYTAFPDGPGGGNPAGVVLDARGLSAADRVSTAARLGYSETAFVEATGTPGRFRVRYASPRAEVSFCGHATIATAVALAERDGPGELVFETLAGAVPVATRATPDGITATLTSVPTRTRPAERGEVDATLAALGWARSDLDPRYPPHVAFAGEHHLVLAVHSRDRLAALDHDMAALQALTAERGWITVHLVWSRTRTEFDARDPFPAGGVVEDPATGAAAAAFGGYLRALGLVPLPARVTIRQGQDMGRPSLLLVDLAVDDDRVRVTGTAAAQAS